MLESRRQQIVQHSGDTLRWVWQQKNETAVFKIAGKPDNTSPFVAETYVTATATAVECTIDRSTKVDVFAYDVIVNPGTPQECTLDPRILIY